MLRAVMDKVQLPPRQGVRANMGIKQSPVPVVVERVRPFIIPGIPEVRKDEVTVVDGDVTAAWRIEESSAIISAMTCRKRALRGDCDVIQRIHPPTAAVKEGVKNNSNVPGFGRRVIKDGIRVEAGGEIHQAEIKARDPSWSEIERGAVADAFFLGIVPYIHAGHFHAATGTGVVINRRGAAIPAGRKQERGGHD